MADPATPTEIRLRRAERRLEVDFADGMTALLPAEYLRVESPSAEVRGHAPHERVWVPGKRQVGIEAAEPVGHYAIRLLFTDGHHTGIFTWPFLRDLWDQHDTRWHAYLAALAERGLSRDE